MRTEEPRAIHLADYQAPDFRIETVHLDFTLDPQATRVTAKLKIARRRAGAPLVLQGEGLKLIALIEEFPSKLRQYFSWSWTVPVFLA